MEDVRVEFFPSYTNQRNFEHDLHERIPDSYRFVDVLDDAVLIERQFYEDNQSLIDTLVDLSGGFVNQLLTDT